MSNKLTPNEQFWKESDEMLEKMAQDKELKEILGKLFDKYNEYGYGYNFHWQGRPIIALPSDVYGFQEIFWKVKPDLIIETGVAHGGSSIFWASMMELLGGDGQVLAIDIDIREHNRVEIENHAMFKRINLIEGSSIAQDTIDKVYDFAKGKKNIMVVLDSNHTHEHVLAEMNAYSKLVAKDSYMIVCDTTVEVLDNANFDNRPWGKGDNPYTAVMQYLKENDGEFTIDLDIERKILLTCATNGWLRKN